MDTESFARKLSIAISLLVALSPAIFWGLNGGYPLRVIENNFFFIALFFFPVSYFLLKWFYYTCFSVRFRAFMVVACFLVIGVLWLDYLVENFVFPQKGVENGMRFGMYMNVYDWTQANLNVMTVGKPEPGLTYYLKWKVHEILDCAFIIHAFPSVILVPACARAIGYPLIYIFFLWWYSSYLSEYPTVDIPEHLPPGFISQMKAARIRALHTMFQEHTVFVKFLSYFARKRAARQYIR